MGDFNQIDLLFLGDFGVWVLILLGLLGAAVLGLSWYDLRDMSPLRRGVLVGLRLLVYAIAVVLLLEPAVELKHVTKIKNHVAVLVDTSRSQTLQVDEGETRLGRAQAFLQRDAVQRLLTTPHEDHLFDLFTFDQGVNPTTLQGAVDPKLPAEGDATRILEAVEDVTNRVGRRDLGGFVLLSDGIDSGLLGGRVRRGEGLDQETRAFIERLGVPIHVRTTARSEGLRDLAVEQVLYDDFAFVRNKVSVDVVLRVVGFEPATIPVTLRREGELLQTQEVEVGPDATEYRVTFEFVPQQIGKEIYSISAPGYSGEALRENNRKDFVLKVIRDKIRALQVVGQPSWDERFLRQLLKNNPNVDLISFFILRTNENVQLVPNDELSLIPFPTRELFEDELGSFDVVLFQNFNFRPYGMSQYLPRIADYVRDGGGFAMIGGELSFTSGGYYGTALADILPVRIPPPGAREAMVDTREFVPQLEEAGLRHPITQLAFDPALNREAWAALPPLEGTNLVLGPQEGATVLAAHPQIQANGQPLPVVTVQEVGEGRSMAVTTDTTWRWAMEGVGQGATSRPYFAFWNAAIRWLIQDPELKLLKVEVAETVVPPGGDAHVNVRLVRSDYAPAAGVTGQLDLLFRPLAALDGQEAEATTALQRPFTTDDRGLVELTLPVDQPGAWTVRAAATTEAGKLTDEDIFLVTLDTQELRSIQPREDLLQQLAQASGGSYAALPDDDADDLTFKPARVTQVNRRRVIEVWDSLAVFALICALLAAEWMLRRRWGRL